MPGGRALLACVVGWPILPFKSTGSCLVLRLFIGAVHGGTHIYSAPEQLLGVRCGPPSDIFSIGLIMLEVMIGVPASGRTFRFDRQLRWQVAALGGRWLHSVAGGCTRWQVAALGARA
jgi:hypothetical protein